MVRVATVLSVIVGLAGAAVLTGYAVREPLLINLAPGLQGMSPVTALGIVLLAVSIASESLRRTRLASIAALAAVSIGLAVLIDTLLAGRDTISPVLSFWLFRLQPSASGLTSPATAVCLAALGAAASLRDRPRAADLAAAIALIVAGLALLGYAYGVQDLYAIPAFGTIALHTGLSMFALAIASLIVRPHSGAAAVVASPDEGGAATRRQLAFLVVPPIAGFVLLRTTDVGHVGPAAAMAFLVVLTIVPLALLILRDGRTLTMLETERQAKIAVQAETSRLLEVRLAEQAAQLKHEAAQERAREAALRESQDFTRLALSAVGGVGAWIYDVASDRFFCDAAVAELYGLDVAQAAGGILREAFLQHVHPDDQAKLAATMSHGAKQSGDLELEYRIVHPDGSTRWVLSRGHTYHDDAGTPLRRTGVGIDMTRQRQLEEQLRQSQKMEAIGQLTGGVAHDFNNLLTVIRSSAEMLQRPSLTDDRRARHIEAIAATTIRAAKLTAQLLAFARRQALNPEVFDVSSSIDKISDMIGTLSGSRIVVETRLGGAATFVNADPSQFDVALINLVANARDAMAGEGRLTIEVTAPSAIPAMRGQTAQDADYVAVAVTDTGSGIPPANLDVIFEPFFTTKTVGHGTGLGLSQVFGFVKQSGGEVGVESTEGRGTTFTVYLPRVHQAPAGLRAPSAMQPLPEAHGTSVLLVEDNAEVGASSAQALQELGYRTVLAAHAEQALTELALEAERFDVVFSDVVMPGMGGIELGRQIRLLYPAMPVVLTSGYSHVLAENGTFGFELLHKPYSIQDLSDVLQKAASWRAAVRSG